MNRVLSRITLSATVLLLLTCNGSHKKKKDNANRARCTSKEVSVLIERIKEFRKSKGIFEPVLDRPLLKAAYTNALNLTSRGNLDHKNTRGGPLKRLQKMGIHRIRVGENIARIHFHPAPGEYFFKYWMQRKDEALNILNPRYLRIGAYIVAGDEYCYCVLLMSN